MNYCCKMICCLLFCFAVGKTFAQKPGKDSMPDYMKRFKYYTLPGFPDSATFFKRADSAEQFKKVVDSLRRKKTTPPVHTILTYTYKIKSHSFGVA